jgi:hypothetical protein
MSMERETHRFVANMSERLVQKGEQILQSAPPRTKSRLAVRQRRREEQQANSIFGIFHDHQDSIVLLEDIIYLDNVRARNSRA